MSEWLNLFNFTDQIQARQDREYALVIVLSFYPKIDSFSQVVDRSSNERDCRSHWSTISLWTLSQPRLDGLPHLLTIFMFIDILLWYRWCKVVGEVADHCWAEALWIFVSGIARIIFYLEESGHSIRLSELEIISLIVTTTSTKQNSEKSERQPITCI